MSANTSFSIVIDNYNYGQFLERALLSAFGQAYPSQLFEIIVVDDGSTDGSRAILERYAGRPGLTVLYQENAGQAAAFARGVGSATRDYVCLLDSDDAFFPGKLRALDARIAALGCPGADLFLCHDLEMRDEEKGTALQTSWFQLSGLAHLEHITVEQARHPYPFAVPSGQVFSRHLLADILEAIPLSDWRTGADSPLAHAALVRTGAVHYLQQPLAQYTLHGKNRLIMAAGDGRVEQRRDAQQRLLERRPKLLWFLERYLDTLPLGVHERQHRIAYLKRVEATLPVTAAHAVVPPAQVSFVVGLPNGDVGLTATLEALARQTHEPCEVLVVPPDAGDIGAIVRAFASAHPDVTWRTAPHAGGAGRGLLAAMKQARGMLLCPITAGDRPDRIFAERHHYVHRYLPSSMVSACDFRFEDGDGFLRDRCYGARELWPERNQTTAFTQSGFDKGGWMFTPRSGNVIRRSAAIDAFIDYGLERGLPDGARAEWLLLHFAAALGACMQFAECLVTLHAVPGDTLGMHLRHPLDPRFLPRLPQPQTTLFYLGLLSARLAEFEAFCGARHWPLFVKWALELYRRPDLDMKAIAARAPLHPAVAVAVASV